MTATDLLPEAIRLVEEAGARGLTVRLLGGLAFRTKVPDWAGRPAGEHPDLDLAIPGSDRHALTALLLEAGYAADRQHNLLHGDRQLYFFHPEAGHSVDVIVDRLVMCHTLDLRGRFELDSPTLDPADLLLSKLQVVRLNEKDAIDILARLSAVPLTKDDAGGISIGRLVSVTSSDWGWWRTATGNLATLRELAGEPALTGGFRLDVPRLAVAGDRLAQLQRLLDEAPKSLGWRLRARLGERVPWYDEPEEVEHAR